VFESPLAPHHAGVRHVLVGLGVATALLGALMCFLQRHLKRMLAYSTISHAGIMLLGLALLDSKSLAGAAHLVLAHGFLKGGLFLVAGILLARLGAVDELVLHGKGRALPLSGVLWFAGALGLAGIPYVGVFLGHTLADEAAVAQNAGWLPPVVMVAQALSAAALLRAGARVFLGWGPNEDPMLTPEPAESPESRDVNLPLLNAVAGVTVALGLVASLVPGLQERLEQGAGVFRDHGGYIARVFGASPHGHPQLAFGLPAPSATSVWYGLGALVLSLALAALGLWHRQLPVLRAPGRVLAPPVRVLKAAHSGFVGDYVLWLAGGTLLLGGLWAVTLR